VVLGTRDPVLESVDDLDQLLEGGLAPFLQIRAQLRAAVLVHAGTRVRGLRQPEL